MIIGIARFLASQGHSSEITPYSTLIMRLGMYRYDLRLHGVILSCACTRMTGYARHRCVGFQKFNLADPDLFSKIIGFVQWRETWISACKIEL